MIYIVFCNIVYFNDININRINQIADKMHFITSLANFKMFYFKRRVFQIATKSTIVTMLQRTINCGTQGRRTTTPLII